MTTEYCENREFLIEARLEAHLSLSHVRRVVVPLLVSKEYLEQPVRLYLCSRVDSLCVLHSAFSIISKMTSRCVMGVATKILLILTLSFCAGKISIMMC